MRRRVDYVVRIREEVINFGVGNCGVAAEAIENEVTVRRGLGRLKYYAGLRQMP